VDLFVCVCVCVFLGVFVGLLPRQLEIACIDPHQTWFVGKGSDPLHLFKFSPSRAPGKGVCGGAKFFFWFRFTTASAQCLRLSERFFHVYYVFIFSLDCSVPVWLSTCCRTGDNNVDI